MHYFRCSVAGIHFQFFLAILFITREQQTKKTFTEAFAIRWNKTEWKIWTSPCAWKKKTKRHLLKNCYPVAVSAMYSPRSGSGRSCAWPRCTDTPGHSLSQRCRNGCPALWCQTLKPPSLHSQDHFHSTMTGAGRCWTSRVHCPKEKSFKEISIYKCLRCCQVEAILSQWKTSSFWHPHP